jgi:translation initiation factor IF-2
MNITELARILKISPQELRDMLPKLGFDIGQKAIKINKAVASKIIKDWPVLRRRMRIEQELATRQERHEIKRDVKDRTISLPNVVTVRDLANVTGVPISAILSVLMKNGIFASLNEKVDFDTAWLVGSELGIEVLRKEAEDEVIDGDGSDTLKDILAKEEEHKMLDRAPVIVVMGHVDHGKTKLLDSIRQAHVVEGEAGGITQHIGAYQVARKGQPITFIDTPGHEAFTAMRSRGAKIADIAILVVAADDGVKQQTVEAFRIIEAAKIPFVVAINKVDKPEANIEKTKQELSNQLGIVPEDWGGKTICAPISALRGQGIDELLDMVLLLAETEADNIKANPEADAVGTIIESHVSKGAGPVATILVQNGTLAVGDQLIFGGVIIGKVRTLRNYLGKTIESAGPAAPAQIIGLRTMPSVGDIVQVGEGERVKHKKVRTADQSNVHGRVDSSEFEHFDGKLINVIIKSDVLGSAEAIEESLEKINTKKAHVKIIRRGLGNISDGDIKQAEASGALVLGFNVKALGPIQDLARERKVEIRLFSIIYDLINAVKEEMKKVVGVEIVRKDLGKMKVKAIFKTDAKSQIVGGTILDNLIRHNSKAEVMRDGTLVAFGDVTSVRCGKEEVTEVSEEQDCGITFVGDPIIQEGDIIQFYIEEKTE